MAASLPSLQDTCSCEATIFVPAAKTIFSPTIANRLVHDLHLQMTYSTVMQQQFRRRRKTVSHSAGNRSERDRTVHPGSVSGTGGKHPGICPLLCPTDLPRSF